MELGMDGMADTALRYWVFPRQSVQDLTRHNPIPAAFLREWEASRPDVLADSSRDLFAQNCRTVLQRETRYDLFSRVESVYDADFVVCTDWLELCEAADVRDNIATLVLASLDVCAGKPIVYSWNHDKNAETVPELQGLPDNVVVLNYNTSCPTPNDLVVPFWNVDTRLPPNTNTNRRWKASFVGQCGGALRSRLKDAFNNRPGYLFVDTRNCGNMPEAEYLEIMRDSWFSLCPRGGGMSSYRFYEAIQQESVPILFADDAVLPFRENIDWGETIVRLPENMAGGFGQIEEILSAMRPTIRAARCAEIRRQCSMAGCQESIHAKITEMLK